MKKCFLFIVVALLATIFANAQTNLSGRVYHNPNILADKLNALMNQTNKEVAEAKEKAYAKVEAKKGRKLTSEEKNKLEAEVDEALKQAKAVAKGMTTAVSVEFTSATDLVMRVDMRVDDAALKAAGIGWLKRKALKAALAMAPKSEKGKYSQKGDLIIIADEKEPDTLRLSDDGKYLYGKLDDDKFTLTRSK